MLKQFFAVMAVAVCMLAVACTKAEIVSPAETANTPPANPVETMPADTTGTHGNEDTTTGPLKGFAKYIIPAGGQYSLQNGYTTVNTDSLVFDVYFDSSAFYTTADPSNQADINKLYGFSDCGSFHQENSARVGWRYYKNNLELLAYCYASGTRSYKLLEQIQPYTTYTCAIVAKPNTYEFYLNGQYMATMQRGCSQGKKYQLYPYFGGDEHAPHEVHIWVKV